MTDAQTNQNLLLSSIVHIRQSGVRSVNIEQDLHSSVIAESYVLTAQSRACLGRMLNRFDTTVSSRAWTLTGPYGSGKSFFGLFLMNLMCATQPAHSRIIDLLKEADPLLGEQVTQKLHLADTAGLFPVPVTGFRAPFYECIKQGFKQAITAINEDKKLTPSLESLSNWSAQTDSRTIIRWIQEFLSVISKAPFGFSGLLLIFDEMGKPLEFAAAHPEAADVYLLQEIAEYANRSGSLPFVFIGILHQAFERYAALLDNTTQREWAKVQGRFEDIAFQEPPTQQMWLMANAFEHSQYNELSIALEIQQKYALEAAESDWRPPIMKPDEFVSLCARVYPLHPTAMVTLPYLFRRLAQNERSIFAYLTSFEPYGLQEFLQQNRLPANVRLSNLFDYLAANFQGRLYASGRARALTEAIERLNNSIRLNPMETDLLKTISLLNWLGEVSHLQATEQSLFMALRGPDCTDEQIQQTLRALQSRSLIVFRRFNRTYTIWQGSDVDIEERMDAARQQLTSAFSLADAVQRYLPPSPLVARRHSYQTGTLRYFEVRYVDDVIRNQVSLTPASGASGMVLLCLPANYAEVNAFQNWAMAAPLSERPDLFIGISGHTTRMTELLHEMRCLYWVKDHTPELRDDPVARRELRSRLSDMESLIRIELDRSISLFRLADGTNCQWFYQGQEVKPKLGEGLSHLLSTVCNALYPHTPRLWNELINRRILSSQGAAARRNLIEAMLQSSEQPEFGISGYPPERSMYESLLLASGIHQQIDNQSWKISDPPERDPLRVLPCWKAISAFIFQQPPEPRPVSDLFCQLSNSPYGLTDGVLPVLLCAFMVAHQNETTLYREGTLLPDPGIPDWEVLIRRPELFSLAGCRVSGSRLAIIKRFAKGLSVEPAVMPVVRILIRQLKSLPEHTWHTHHLPESALAVRKAVQTAQSPERFLFHDLPLAVGSKPFDEVEPAAGEVEDFFTALNASFEALNSATPKLRLWARDEFLKAFGMNVGEESWRQFLETAEEMAPRVAQPNLIPLLKRAAEAVDERSALESVLAQVANRPLKTWTDSDMDRFAGQARYLGNLFQVEREGNTITPVGNMTPQQRIRSQQIAKDLHGLIQETFKDEAYIIKAALQYLLKDLG